MNIIISLLCASEISLFLYGILSCIADSLHKSEVPDSKLFYNIYDGKLTAVSSMLEQIEYGLWKYSNGVYLNRTDNNKDYWISAVFYPHQV